MTAKKRWLNKIYSDSQDSTKNNTNISWSNSDSDEELVEKKRKTHNVNRNTNTTATTGKWITSSWEHCAQNQRSAIENIEIDIHCASRYQSTNCILNGLSANVTSGSFHIKPNNKFDTSVNHSCESPIVNNLKLEELSPVLIPRKKDVNTTKEASPVLGKRSILRRIRMKSKRTVSCAKPVDESSPDLFETEVIDYESPELKTGLPECELEHTNLPPTKQIDPFPSQDSSQVINSNTSSSSSKNDNISLYHQPAPKRKRYKKGGLASLLQKALYLQRTRTAIWQHEVYTKKTNNMIDFEGDKVIDFFVKNKWKEYGGTILECYSSNTSQTYCDESSKNKENTFLIIIGFNSNLSINSDSEVHYKLFPPYSTKTVIFKSKETLCYFNTTKIANSII